jgi:PAS domain S-box-containing protein
MELSLETFDVAKMVEEVVGTVQPLVGKNANALEVRCAAGIGEMHADLTKVRQVLFNLVSNACKFTFLGEIAVSLRATQSAVEVSVRDTRTEIPVDALPRLFERFYRVEGAHGRTYEGSGIGLALVQELVRLHGGSVRVESKLGQGTTFTITVRFGREHLPQDRIDASTILASTATGATPFVEEALRWLPDAVGDSSSVLDEFELVRPRSLGLEHPGRDSVANRPKILFADDNADMRGYLARLLSEQFDVEAVPDGLAALEVARLRKPDLMLADVMMPRLDGLQLLQALRADAATADIPCILLSARAGEEARVEGIRAGADDYLTKPFSARELMARVDAHIKLARIRREAEQALRMRTVQFEALFNQAPLGIYLVDPDFCIREVNPIALPVFGDIPGGVRGRDFGEIIHVLWEKSYADEVVRIFRHTLETGEPYVARERAEFRVDRGLTEYYEWRLDRITFPDGRYGLACYFRDISERVQARLLLEQQAEELHRANRVKDEFLAMLGHELRNPLSPITTALQLMRLRGAQSREQEIIERQVGHLTRLVDDLLDVSRITRGAIELRKQPMELAEAVVRSIEIASPLLEQRRHRLEVDVPRMGLGVLADEGRLAQILSNLLTNAAKYSDIGSRIELKARRHGDHVVVSVKDEGIGIEQTNIEKIFGLFVQGPQTVERSRGGLGLGLLAAVPAAPGLGANLFQLLVGQDRGLAEHPGQPVRAGQPLQEHRVVVGLGQCPAVADRAVVGQDRRPAAVQREHRGLGQALGPEPGVGRDPDRAAQRVDRVVDRRKLVEHRGQRDDLRRVRVHHSAGR